MDRDVRNLQHLKAGSKALSMSAPAASSMQNGEERYAVVSGVLYLYVKQQNQLWRFTATKV